VDNGQINRAVGQIGSGGDTFRCVEDRSVNQTGRLRNQCIAMTRFETDTLRGLAIIAVLFHHAVLWAWRPLEQYASESSTVFVVAAQFAALVEPIRMPLFTILSAWIYAGRPVSTDKALAFIRAKARRLLLPLVFVSTVVYVELYFFEPVSPRLKGRGPEELWKFWFEHFGHLWFVQALFTIFLMVVVVESLGWMRSVRAWVIWLLVLTFLPYVFPSTSVWSLSKTAELAVFFCFGVGLRRFSDGTIRPGATKLAWAVFCAAMVANGIGVIGHVDVPLPRLMDVLAGTTGAICLISLKLKSWPLAWIGSFSYTIYLYQGTGFHVHRFFDELLGLGSLGQAIWLALMLSLAIAIPIGIHVLVRHVPIIRTPVLGLKPLSIPWRSTSVAKGM
jgi:fucose 4-O-acetylase-like acetyltransferase